MPPTKTLCIVLKTLPYRETSCILHLYSKELGLVQGIAKGIRRKSKEQIIIERGFLIEALVYGQAGAGLRTLGGIGLVDYFSKIRSDLARSAVRDTILETLQSGLHDSDENEELFTFLSNTLARLDAQSAAQALPFAIWRFYADFSAIEGFGLNLETCLTCGKRLGGGLGGRLKTDTGGIICATCEPHRGDAALVPGFVVDFINCQSTEPTPAMVNLDKRDRKRITRLLASYCRYHFDNRYDYKSLDFIDELIDSATTK